MPKSRSRKFRASTSGFKRSTDSETTKDNNINDTKLISSSTSENKSKDVQSTDEKYVFFYGKESPFSQHHPADFVIDGITFNCCEQFMMYSKAVAFNDEAIKERILSSTNPVEQKRLGRQVDNFVKDVWDEQSVIAVKAANKAKFSQNEDLKKELLATYPSILVEASPRDCIWGIGLGASNPKARDRKTWRGQNKLGFILTEVREELMQENKGGETAY